MAGLAWFEGEGKGRLGVGGEGADGFETEESGGSHGNGDDGDGPVNLKQFSA